MQLSKFVKGDIVKLIHYPSTLVEVDVPDSESENTFAGIVLACNNGEFEVGKRYGHLTKQYFTNTTGEDYNSQVMTREQEDQFDGELATKRLAEGGKRYTSEEVKAQLDEQEAATGLDICGYAGKWKKAKESEKPGPDYWSRVRTHFLELGGGYTNQQ